MKKSIWKYQIDVKTNTLLKMPKGAIVLSVQNQHETICLWAQVDPNHSEIEERLFQVFGTGATLPEEEEFTKRIHIDTVQMLKGSLVLHVFETILN